MDQSLVAYKRKSHLEVGEIYFWTATINKWQYLLQGEEFKQIIVKFPVSLCYSLEYLSQTNKIDVFAFVIMPNHIHLIWRINENNGKETAQASFLKYTAHEFKKKLKQGAGDILSNYRVNDANKDFEFWQRDPLAIHLYTQKVAYQKLDYIHLNPLAKHWQLVKDPYDYKYSTARFYENGFKNFSFVKDLRNEL